MSESNHCTNVEEIGPVKKKFSFDIPWPDVKKELDSAYREIGRKARVKGFRPGKTPRKVLETYYREEAEGEAISSIINKVYWAAVEENKVLPVSKPVIDQKGIEPEKDFSFTATVEVKPAIEPKDYLGIEVEKEELEVVEEDIQERLEGLRQVYSTLEDLKEDRSIREQDFVSIDFEGRLDGVSRKDLKAENYLLEIGSKKFVPGFEEQLIGANRGETKEISVTFPADYHSSDLAGKKVVFSVTIKAVKEKIVPALDETFVKNFEKYETLEAIRADLRKAIEEEKQSRIKSDFAKAVIGKLLERNPLEVPESLVERQIYSMMMDAQRRMAENGMDPKKSAEIAARMHDRFKEEAERMVKASLLLESIAERESIEVEDKDLEERLRKIGERYGQDPESVRQLYEKEDLLDNLRAEVREEKTLDFIEGKAKIKRVKKAKEKAADGVDSNRS